MEINKSALTDYITGLPNRRAMELFAKRELRRRARHSDILSFGLMRIDYFDDSNHFYLHPASDKMLAEVAAILVNAVREVDFLGRVDGNEFWLLAPGADNDAACALGERMRSLIEGKLAVKLAIGFVVIDDRADLSYDQIRYQAAASLSRAVTW